MKASAKHLKRAVENLTKQNALWARQGNAVRAVEKTVGIYIRTYREEHELSLRDVAAKLRCSVAFLSDMELGYRPIPERIVEEIGKLVA
jgi:hypothetical protein